MSELSEERARYARRRIYDLVFRAACVVAMVLALAPLVAILGYVILRGLSAIDLSFFTSLPKPPGEEGGGMINAIVGTLTMVGIATVVGVPLGLLAGIYLSEFGKGFLGSAVRFAADVMSGIPSIVSGLFIYAVVVVPMRRFSALAGGLALALVMLPTVTRTTEELLRVVPLSLRESALALGVPKWRAILRVALPTAAPGITTGVVLAIARIMGETAPLLFTALNNNGWPEGIDQPTASLTVQIYNYAGSPYEDQQGQAWAAALVLLVLVLAIDLTARLLVPKLMRAR